MKKDKKTVIGIILAIIAVGCLIVGIILLRYSLLGKDRSGAPEVNNAVADTTGSGNETATEPDNAEQEQTETEGDSEDEVTEEVVEEHDRVPNPYSESFLQNEDMAAWIYIPDTVIDYPVMYTPFDENYYLNRDFNKNSNANGCLILDTDSSMEPLSTNLIIHGHNMGSGAMFGTLTKYENQEYCENHKYIYLYGKDYEHIYEVIAVFRSKVFYKTDVAFKYYKFFNATTQEEFDDFYDNILAMSTYSTDLTAEFGDRFITLSTCAYHVENGRFVVVAKEIEPGEYYLPVDTVIEEAADAENVTDETATAAESND